MPSRDQTERIGFEDAGGTEPYARALDEDRIIRTGDEPDEFRVQLGEGDVHEVLLAGLEGEMYGACDCDGWAFHREGVDGWASSWARPCAHLCAVRQEHVLEDLIPESFANEVQDVSAEVVDVADQEERSDEQDAVDEPDVPAPSEPAAPAQQRDDPFADVLENVPERFVMTLDGEPYIRREGYARLARQVGLSVESEMITWASETDLELAEARAVVRDDDGRTWTGSATAHRDTEDLLNAHANLNELAETRAITRALSWATGAGISAMEVAADQDDLAGDRPTARADGGDRR